MDGENKYRAENFGLQDARKGSRFLKFPSVLQLQLKRFEYDPYADAMVKVSFFFLRLAFGFTFLTTGSIICDLLSVICYLLSVI